MSGSASRRSLGDSLLRISQACETLVAGYNSGQAAAVKSGLISRERAMSSSKLDSRDLLPPLEGVMAQRRTRPSLLLPAWRAVGFVVGTGATTLLPPEASVKVRGAITKTVSEQYDANIRTMYDSSIVEEEIEVKDLFKSQRDERSQSKIWSSDDEDRDRDPVDVDANTKAARAAGVAALDSRSSMAIEGALKSALRVAFDVTSKV